MEAARKYLHNGRHQLIQRPQAEDVQRVVGYRTETCLAFRAATAERRPDEDVLRYLEGEHEWALGVMLEAGIVPPGLGFHGPPRPESGEQQTLF